MSPLKYFLHLQIQMLIFGAKNSNLFTLKLNAARFARKVVKRDFLSDFQTL